MYLFIVPRSVMLFRQRYTVTLWCSYGIHQQGLTEPHISLFRDARACVEAFTFTFFHRTCRAFGQNVLKACRNKKHYTQKLHQNNITSVIPGNVISSYDIVLRLTIFKFNEALNVLKYKYFNNKYANVLIVSILWHCALCFATFPSDRTVFCLIFPSEEDWAH